MATSRRWITGSTTGTTTSTRRSRLRSIMSGEPNHTRSGRPCSPPKRKILECSRNRPTTDRTRIPSESPGTPGRMLHRPLTTRSIETPPADARYRASMTSGSVSPLVFTTMRPSGPAAPSASMAATTSARVDTGDTTRRRSCNSDPDPVNRLNTSATSAPMSGSAVSNPMSS